MYEENDKYIAIVIMLQTSTSEKYRRGSKNENIGNIRENIEKYVVGMKNNVVRLKISENIVDPDFEDNITNIMILSRCW
jgi:hypothetical protein